MITYKTEQCQHCSGKGKVRFLLLFEQDCPECNGTGQIQVPQITQEKEKRQFSVSALSPETLTILKNKPLLLNCLSPANRADLMRKHSELQKLPPTGLVKPVESEAEKRRSRYEEMAYADEQRRRFANFMQRQNDNLLRQSQEQHQRWADEQFRNFVQAHAHFEQNRGRLPGKPTIEPP